MQLLQLVLLQSAKPPSPLLARFLPRLGSQVQASRHTSQRRQSSRPSSHRARLSCQNSTTRTLIPCQAHPLRFVRPAGLGRPACVCGAGATRGTLHEPLVRASLAKIAKSGDGYTAQSQRDASHPWSGLGATSIEPPQVIRLRQRRHRRPEPSRNLPSPRHTAAILLSAQPASTNLGLKTHCPNERDDGDGRGLCLRCRHPPTTVLHRRAAMWGMVVRLKLAPGLALLPSSGTCAARLLLAAGKMRPGELALGYRLRHGRRSRVMASPTGDTAKMGWHEQVERRQSLPRSNAPSQRHGLQGPLSRDWCVQTPMIRFEVSLPRRPVPPRASLPSRTRKQTSGN